jgi:hypothetical protein
MRVHCITPLLTAGLVALAASGARAEAPLSGTAYAGLVFTDPGVSSGAWVGLQCRVAPHWSLGAEAGHVVLSGGDLPVVRTAMYTGNNWPTSLGLTLRSASAVLRGRSAGPVRLHFLGSFGYYDLETRTHYSMSPDQVEHERLPGFGLAIGFAGTGLVRPGFQLRWDEVIRPHNEYLDVISFAVGLHFN